MVGAPDYDRWLESERLRLDPAEQPYLCELCGEECDEVDDDGVCRACGVGECDE